MQLYNAIRELILNGALSGGQRMPATRVLAEEMMISRTTVLTVYDRLVTEGLVESKQGAGNFVSESLKQRTRTIASLNESESTQQAPSNLSQAFNSMYEHLPIRVETSEPQAFSTAIPAVDVFPMERWGRLLSRHSKRKDLVRYNTSKGYPPLCEAIAAHLQVERGLECHPDQIFITSGAQQALYFLGELLLDPGDKVWFENPGSRVARNSFSARGADLIPVPIDENGIQVEKAIELAPEFKLVSVTPSHQQPQGSIMSLSRRLELLNAADAANAWIIEDDFDGEFFYSNKPLPTLFSIASNKRVFYVGTFSKSMFPSLRLGYFVAPETLTEKLYKAVGSYLPAVPLMLQAATAEFIDRGHFSTHVRKAKRVYRERYKALSQAVELYLDDYLELIPTETGFHALAMFKQDIDERVLAEKAGEKGVIVRPLSNYCLEPLVGRQGIALGFGCVSEEEITLSVKKLLEAFREAK